MGCPSQCTLALPSPSAPALVGDGCVVSCTYLLGQPCACLCTLAGAMWEAVPVKVGVGPWLPQAERPRHLTATALGSSHSLLQQSHRMCFDFFISFVAYSVVFLIGGRKPEGQRVCWNCRADVLADLWALLRASVEGAGSPSEWNWTVLLFSRSGDAGASVSPIPCLCLPCFTVAWLGSSCVFGFGRVGSGFQP